MCSDVQKRYPRPYCVMFRNCAHGPSVIRCSENSSHALMCFIGYERNTVCSAVQKLITIDFF